jgi:hypothetical protein
MSVIRFSDFFDKVRSGEKRQTIRPASSYKHLRVGGRIHAYSTKRVEGVRRPVLDELLYEGVCKEILVRPWKEIKNDELLAVRDGFDSARAMRIWFIERYGGEPSDDSMWRIIRW